MTRAATAVLILALLAVGIVYLRFCKNLSEDLINRVKSRRKEKEGGDNWPGIQLEMDGFDGCDGFTYRDIEREDAQIKTRDNKFCG